MPVEPSYRDKIYANLVEAFGQDELPSIQDFNKKLDSDQGYASKLYDNLASVYGKDELPSLEDFSGRLKKKVLGAPPSEPLSLGFGSAPQALAGGYPKTSTSKSTLGSASVDVSKIAQKREADRSLPDFIPPKPQTLPDPDAIDTGITGLKVGVDKTLAAVTGLPDAVFDYAIAPILEAMSPTDIAQPRELTNQAIEQTRTIFQGSIPFGKEFANTSAKLTERAAQLQEENKSIEGKSMIDEMSKGNINDAVKIFTAQVGEFIPLIAEGIYAPGALAPTIFAQNIQQLKDREDLTYAQKSGLSASLATIQSIAIPLAASGITSAFAPLAAKVGTEEAKQALAQTYYQAFLKNAGEVATPTFKNAAIGAAMDLATQVAEHAIDPASKDMGINWSMVGDAAITFGLPAGGAKFVNKAYHGVYEPGAKEKIKGMEASIDKVEEDLAKEDVGSDTKETLAKLRDDLVKQVNDAVVKDAEKNGNTDPEKKKAFDALNEFYNEIDAALQEPNLTAETRAGFEAQQEHILKEYEKLKEEKDATEEINQQEGVPTEPEGGNESGKIAETSTSDSVLSPEEGKEKVEPPAEVPVEPVAEEIKPVTEELADLTEEEKKAFNQEAADLGFDHPVHAINAVNESLGTDYKSFKEIPKEDLALVAKERAALKENEGEHPKGADELLREHLIDLTDKLNRAKSRLTKTDLINQIDVVHDILNEKDPTKKKMKAFIQTVKGSAKTTAELNEKVNELNEFYKATTNAESIAKADKIIGKDVSKARELAMDDSPPTAEKSALAVRLIKHFEKIKDYASAVEVLNSYDKQLREAGRFIQAASLWNKLSPESILRVANKYVENLSVEAQEAIYQKVVDMGKMEEGPEKSQAILDVLNYIAENSPATFREKFDAFRYQNMLSNPKSHLRNIYGNLFNVMITEPGAIATKSTMELLRNPFNPAAREAKFSQIPKYYKEIYNNLPNAMLAAKEVMKNGYAADKILDLPNAENMIEALRKTKLPKHLTFTLRLLEAQDRFFNVLVVQGEKARLLKAGYTEAEATKRATELGTELLYRDKLDAGNKNNAYAVRALDALGQGINNLRRLPVVGESVSWFAPFVMTPINVAKFQVKHSPLGFLGGSHSKAQVAQASVGTLIMGLGAIKAMQGETEWAAPTDPEERELFYASGRKPYSVKVGDHWVPMAMFGPAALAYALPAAVAHYYKNSKTAMTDSDLQKISQAIISMSGYIISQTPFTGLEESSKVFEGKPETNIGKVAGQLTQQVIPFSGLIRYVNNWLDPIYRKSKGYLESIQSGLPLASQELEAYEKPFKDSQIQELDLKNAPLPQKDQSVKSLINNLSPYDFGLNDEEYSLMLKNRREVRQQNEASKQREDLGARAKELDKELSNTKEVESIQSKEKRVKLIGKEDKLHHPPTTEEEKKLRAKIENSQKKFADVVNQLDKLPPAERKTARTRWIKVGIIPETVADRLKVDAAGNIDLKK